LSRRFSPWLFAAAGGLLLAAGLVVILFFPMRAAPRSARDDRNSRGSLHARDRVAREAFFHSRRGLNFGVPHGAYRAAIAHMRRRERKGVGSAKLEATGSTQAGAAFAWNALGPIPLTNEIPTFGGVAMGGALAGVTGRVTAVVADPTVSGRMPLASAGLSKKLFVFKRVESGLRRCTRCGLLMTNSVFLVLSFYTKCALN